MANIPTISQAEKDPFKLAAALRQAVEKVNGLQTTLDGGFLITDGDKGDITIASSGASFTIDNNAVTTAKIADNNVTTAKIADDNVTNAKLANMATKTYKGRTSGSTGDPEDVAAATVRADIEAERLGVIRGQVTPTTNYTLVLTDAGKAVVTAVGSANTLTIPPSGSVAFEAGTYVNVIQAGAGQTTIAPGSGVTIVAYNSALKLAGTGAMATLYYQGSNVWYAGGNLVP